MHSDLCTGVFIADSSNYTQGRNGYSICKFTPHMMAGILSGEQCAVNIFQNPSRNASANYCIGNGGDLVCNVEEENRAWTSSSRSNDYQAITVEVSNCEYGGEWKVSDEAWNTLVNLAVDVCRRYGFRLYYDGTPNGSLTTHNMFANTDCPGPYLLSKMNELANTVNTILDGGTPAPEPTPEPSYSFNTFVREVQSAIGARVDGIPGPETLSKTPTISKSKNRKHAVVKPVQKYLYSIGYTEVGTADGITGPKFDSAVKHFQRDNGCVQDGEMTAHNKTWKKILRLA